MSVPQELQGKMSTACAILEWELANMWGHVSVRTPDSNGVSLMPIRRPVDPNIPADDLLEYDIEGKMTAGRRDAIDEVFSTAARFEPKTKSGR